MSFLLQLFCSLSHFSLTLFEFFVVKITFCILICHFFVHTKKSFSKFKLSSEKKRALLYFFIFRLFSLFPYVFPVPPFFAVFSFWVYIVILKKNLLQISFQKKELSFYFSFLVFFVFFERVFHPSFLFYLLFVFFRCL